MSGARCFGLLVLAVAAIAAVGVTAPGAARAREGPAGEHRALLDHGSLLGHEWQTAVFARKAQPCFEMQTEFDDVRSWFYECSKPRRGFIPIIFGQSGEGEEEGTVVLIATPLEVHRVHLNFSGRRDQDVWPKRISRRKARRAGVNPNFRYKTLAAAGDFCLRRHVDYKRDSRIYYRSYRYPPCDRQASLIRRRGGFALSPPAAGRSTRLR
jgi:hypothetical protein